MFQINYLVDDFNFQIKNFKLNCYFNICLSTMENNNSEKLEIIYPIAITIIILILWGLSWVLINCFVEERGTFGDMFGSVNSLFSGLALAGIIYSILLQRKELQLQRLELMATRKELARSAEAEEKSAQLNALSTLVNHFHERERQTPPGAGDIKAEFDQKRHRYVKELEDLYHNKIKKK